MTLQPIRVLIDGHDSDGRLILAYDQLTAVIVRLDAEHHSSDLHGKWHLEAGFGKCAAGPGNAPTWDTPENAAEWVQETLSGRTQSKGDVV